jgi:alcohol dehydrogenase class IV
MQFTVPREIYYGYGTLENITRIPAERAVVVSDAVMASLGWVDRVKAVLEAAGTEVRVFAEVEPDPCRDTVAKGAEIMREFGPQVIVGLGGGSAIDAAKAMWVFYELPDITWEAACEIFGMPPLRNKARFIAVASTSGTGTEVGNSAVITDRSVQPAIKRFMCDYELTPDVTIADPELCLTMPPEVTANTGMDVIAHALEAYVTAGANDISDGLAIKALQLTFEWLPAAVSDGSDRTAREKMHYASMIAGQAFNNAGLGINHSLAHQLGSVWGVPHGRANAVVMPNVIAFNAEASAERYADVARALGVSGKDSGELVSGLIEKLFELMTQIDMPRSIAELDIAADAWDEALEVAARNAFDDGCTGDNVRQPTYGDLKGIYMRSREGLV